MSVDPVESERLARFSGKRRWMVVAVLLLAFLAYAPALGNEFAFDDTLARATTNDGPPDRMIAEFHPPWYFFMHHYWTGEFRESHLYRPITILSYALTYHLVSKPLLPADWEMFPHHLINLLLNAWAVYLVMWLMLDLGVAALGALLAAAMFGVHAIHSEVVAGIVGRAELLSFCLGVAGLQVYRRVERGAPRAWLVAAGVLFFTALCSKESAVAWLPFLPCYIAVRAWQRGEPARPVLAASAPRMIVLAVTVLVVFLVLRHFAVDGSRADVFYAANPLYHEPAIVRLLTAIKVWGYAIYKCIAPFSLACLYGPVTFTLVESPVDLGFLAATVAIAGWCGFGLWRPAHRPLVFLSVAFFFGFSLLTSNVPFAIGTIFGERLYFIPSLGVCMLPALLLPRLRTGGRRVVVAACLVWIAVNIVVDFERSQVWKNNEILMLNDAVVQPKCASLQLKAATTERWRQTSDPDRKEFHEKAAWRLLRRARELDPDYVSAMATEATFHVQDEDYDAAIELLRKALAAKRLKISGLEARIRGDLGHLLIEQKNQRRAGVDELLEAVRLRPQNRVLRFALLHHGMGLLPPEVMQKLVVESVEMFPREIFMTVIQAAFIYEYGERTQENAQHVVDFLEQAFRAAPADVLKEKRYIEARLQLADCLRALGRKADARRSFSLVVPLEDATEEQRKRAREGLADLDK